jgi:transposase InsO family protein
VSYCKGKNIEKSRGKAMKMLVMEKKPVSIVADRFGVHRSTIWRWYQRWILQNNDKVLVNHYRSSREPGKHFRWANVRWDIPSIPAIPKHPRCLPEDLVQLVLDIRDQLKRCAEIVWHHINTILCIRISLSSVRRILKRNNRTLKPKYHRNRQYKGIPRPKALMLGDLVETDTIHLYNPVSKQKRYIYTVIDVYTRMAYARVYKELKPVNSLNTILEAQQYFGFQFKMVQSDNGLEFSKYFSDRLETKGIKVRHTRLGRPNDNAHIERFNRTIQEECTGNYYLENESLKSLDNKILSYIDHYNYNRIHLSLSYRTPSQMLHRF